MLSNVKSYLADLLPSHQLALWELHPEQRDCIARIRANRLTYLSDRRLARIATTCTSIEDRNLPGLFVEAGCALGGSSILIASLKAAQRPLFVYDTFEMIPPPTDEDTAEVHERYRRIREGTSKGIGGDTYYGYQPNLYDLFETNLKRFGLDLDANNVVRRKGLLQDTMKIDQPVAFAHIDVDWYAPVLVSLQRLFPHLVVGGSIIVDDYSDWGGCRKATDTFLREVRGNFDADCAYGSLRITRTRT